MSLFYKEIATIVGKLKIIANPNALVAILWEKEKPNRIKFGSMHKDEQLPIFQITEQQLTEYFSGHRTIFDLAMEYSGTKFQKEVWQALEKIPYGSTLSYREVAHAIARPNSIRAVANAIGKNPLSIITPCHRVIGTNGHLTGFAGGLEAKAILLKLEAATIPNLKRALER